MDVFVQLLLGRSKNGTNCSNISFSGHMGQISSESNTIERNVRAVMAFDVDKRKKYTAKSNPICGFIVTRVIAIPMRNGFFSVIA